MISILRKIYRRYIHWPRLDKFIYAILDFLTDIYSYLRGYSFPKNYIRRWKLDMLWELYEKETCLLFKKIIKPDMVIVDLGAHIGYFTKLFSKLVGKNGVVYAFEADPENFQILQRNVKNLRNVRIYQMAITDHAGMIDFYHCEEKAGCHSILPNVPLNFKMRKITVPASDLETILLKEGVTKFDMIKMDIEGGESAAINGMENILKQNHDMSIVVEFAPDWITTAGNNPLNFLKKLASFGFTIFAIRTNQLVKLNPNDPKSYEKFLVKEPNATDSYNNFINLYCTKTASEVTS